MKKIALVVAAILLIGGSALASTQKATVINLVTGVKKVINVGDHFPGGFTLMGAPSLGASNNYNNTLSVNYTNSTTSPISWTSLSSSTAFVIRTGDIDKLNLLIQEQASSSTTSLSWINEYSDNGIDWYGEDGVQASSTSIVHGTSTVVHAWTPGTTSVARKSIIVTPFAEFTRITLSPVVGLSSFFAKVITKTSY